MKRGLQISALFLISSVSASALAEDNAAQSPALGLPPGAPQTAALPGGVTPAYHKPSTEEGDWRFDFHGFLTIPLRASIGSRDNPTKDQSKMTLHAPPIVPDYRDSFNHTGVVPQPYVRLLFTYGNSIVTGNISIDSHQTATGGAFFDPPSNPGVTDAFVNLNLPNIAKGARFDVNVGAFTNRYGVMGEYDEGQYGTPLIARTNALGETINGTFALGDLALIVEQGFGGQADKFPKGIGSAGWNGFADDNVGASWVNHLHAGLGFKGLATLGVHYLTAWTQDDRVGGLLPDGRINVLGADLRFTLGHFGHLYVAGSSVNADKARTVGKVIQILNTDGGPGLMTNYLGPASGGTGKLLTIGGQYDLSIARLMRYPEPYAGDAPDIVISLFGMQTKVDSDDKTRNPFDASQYLYDNTTKRKFGGELSYAFIQWLAISARYDQVTPSTKDTSTAFGILSPRLIFRSGWNAHDQVTLQYSHFFYGDRATVRDGYPPVDNVAIVPDDDMISLSASMWW